MTSNDGFVVIAGHTPIAAGGYAPFFHKLPKGYPSDDPGKVYVGVAFDPVFYSVDSLYFYN